MSSKFLIEYCCINALGNVRSNNEDNFYAGGNFRESEFADDISLTGSLSPDQNEILAVYDGMGGEACGEIASYLAASGTSGFRLSADEDPADGLRALCNKLNNEICSYADENATGCMGSTAAIILFEKKNIFICNLGDSRIYHMYGKKLTQISVDHVAEAAEGRKAALVQFLGVPEDHYSIEPYISKGSYKAGDKFLICSDGITDMLSDDEIADIMRNNDTERSTELLADAAKKNGGRDNITLIVAEVKKKSFLKK